MTPCAFNLRTESMDLYHLWRLDVGEIQKLSVGLVKFEAPARHPQGSVQEPVDLMVYKAYE